MVDGQGFGDWWAAHGWLMRGGSEGAGRWIQAVVQLVTVALEWVVGGSARWGGVALDGVSWVVNLAVDPGSGSVDA